MVSGALASARHLCRLAGRTCQFYGRNNLEKTEVREREKKNDICAYCCNTII